MPAALARHDDLVVRIVCEAGGVLVKSRGEGDSCFAVFDTSAAAVSAALAIQRAMAVEPWPPAVDIRIRCAVHTGNAEERGGDFYGGTVNRAARIRSAAHGGQIVLSETTASLVEGQLPAGAALVPLGSHRLRDLSAPERIYQLAHPDLRSEFPPLQTLEHVRHNLPVQLTAFVGREEQLRQVGKLLHEHRLVTIAGGGGIGKTRVALQLAADGADGFADGVWFASFAAVTDDSLVVRTMASVLGIRETAGRPVLQSLLDCLRYTEALVVLDNCEHLVAACAELAEMLLRSCPGVRLIATSREPLGVPGEQLWRLPALELPPAEAPADELALYESVRLFVDRAALVRPDFVLDRRNADAVRDLCRRLEGIPLALELAAARLDAMTASELLDRLTTRLRMLKGGRRATPRQQTLRDTIDWSYGLLAEAERYLFCRLSIFAGGCTLAAAEDVCAGGRIPDDDMVDLLHSLCEKSLVSAEQAEGETRYRMLETIREYGAERLRLHGEEPALARTHLAWCVRVAGRAERELYGPSQVEWLDRLEREHDNFRSALGWACTEPSAQVDALRLAVSLAPFWSRRGYFTEGRRRLAQASADTADAALEARALNWSASLADEQGDYGEARQLCEQAMVIARRHGDEDALARATLTLAGVAWVQGDVDGGLRLSVEALQRSRTLGNASLEVLANLNLGSLARVRGDHADAAASFEDGLKLAREIGDLSSVARATLNLGNVAWARGDYAEAAARYEEALLLARELGQTATMARVTVNLGNVAWTKGHHDEAQTRYAEGLALLRQLGERSGIARTITNLGSVARALGDLTRASELCSEGLSLFRELGERAAMAWATTMIGRIAQDRGDLDRAHASCEEAVTLARDVGDPHMLAMSLLGLGDVLLAREDHSAAQRAIIEALSIAGDVGDKQLVADAMQSLAELAHKRGDSTRAALLLGAEESLREGLGAVMPPIERLRYEELSSSVRRLDEAGASWAEGRRLGWQAVVDNVLDRPPRLD